MTSPSGQAPPSVRDLAGGAERIHLIGPPGSGKTWLADRVARLRGWPVHHLDQLGHVDGGGSALRGPAELDTVLRDLHTQPRWVSEGIDLGWTEPILEAADLIVWLDDDAWRAPAWRIVKRFVAGGIAEARRQRGWRRFGRFRDYAARLRQLAGALPAARSYAGSSDATPGAETRASFEAALRPHEAKLLRWTGAAPRDELLRMLAAHEPDLPSG